MMQLRPLTAAALPCSPSWKHARPPTGLCTCSVKPGARCRTTMVTMEMAKLRGKLCNQLEALLYANGDEASVQVWGGLHSFKMGRV